jgi:hypothetical protein
MSAVMVGIALWQAECSIPAGGLTMAGKTKKCAHPACMCMVGPDEKYCSDYCHDAGSTLEISCNCAHAGCAVSEGEPAMKAGG